MLCVSTVSAAVLLDLSYLFSFASENDSGAQTYWLEVFETSARNGTQSNTWSMGDLPVATCGRPDLLGSPK